MPLRCGRLEPPMSQMGQSTKSLRSSPLRGGKSREAGSDGEDSDSGGATINSRIVGVIKNSKSYRRPKTSTDSEKLAMSTMGPLCPEQLTQEETLDEVCVGPKHEVAALQPAARGQEPRGR
jgi:hypothetical protein